MSTSLRRRQFRETWLVRARITEHSVARDEGSSVRRDLPAGAIQPYPLREE